jgi:hypothetical protein
LDRVFTTIDSAHCDQTSVLDWGSNYSDHRPVLISVNLHSLCTGWLEFPQTQVTPPRININVENKKKMKDLEELTGKWSQKHAKTTIDNLAPVKSNSAEGRYESLKQIFVELPQKTFPLGKEKAELYKPRTLGIAEEKFKWINRYLRAL